MPERPWVAAALVRAHALEQPAFIRVLSETETSEAAAGAPVRGPLAGVAFAVKDNLDVLGVPTTAGDPARAEPAARNAAAVRRLVEAGAAPIGKTNMDRYATGLLGTRSRYGTCSSVFSSEHVAGGSSTGSAVAVAAGVVPLALGTDTAGSGRVPAAFNGIVGLMPTRGLISTAGLLSVAPSLDTVTTFTRTVAEARRALEALGRHDPEDISSRAKPWDAGLATRDAGHVIAVPDGRLDLEPEHDLAWKSALAHAATVARLVPVEVRALLPAARLLHEAAFVVDGRRDRSPGAGGGEGQVGQLARLREACQRIFAACDALLLPAAPWHPTFDDVAADPIGANARTALFTTLANLVDLCAVAVPAGFRPDGLPFGVQLLAPPFADLALLELAARWTGERV